MKDEKATPFEHVLNCLITVWNNILSYPTQSFRIFQKSHSLENYYLQLTMTNPVSLAWISAKLIVCVPRFTWLQAISIDNLGPSEHGKHTRIWSVVMIVDLKKINILAFYHYTRGFLYAFVLLNICNPTHLNLSTKELDISHSNSLHQPTFPLSYAS